MGFSADMYVMFVWETPIYWAQKKGNRNGKGEIDRVFLSELRL